ncbi:leucine-rich repeat-containing G protein-coupled receptor 1 [Haematobia irritans]|uniref:leucine-rich repeat-containing G protein-coupled receptor 1 n=1 Tax=Haematobia irritans TaxID=7368 RepID=UPI003F507A93
MFNKPTFALHPFTKMHHYTQNQQQRQRNCYSHDQHRKHLCLIKVPKRQHQLLVPAFQMLRFLLILVCYSCCISSTSASVEYNNGKQSNCYDKAYGFRGYQLFNDTMVSANNVLWDSGNFTSSRVNETMGHGANGQSRIATERMSTGENLVEKQSPGWECCCWNVSQSDEMECRCEGESLLRVPQTLTVPLQRLTIESSGLPRLRSTALKVYNASLSDIVLKDLKYLETIQDGAFANLKRLRTIYISHAPKLEYLSKNVFEGISDTIKVIRIINSGLTQIPDLTYLPTTNILQMIDLDNNHITRIESKSIQIKTDQLILANNYISYIDDSAFYGSQIAKLILKGNLVLREVHLNAFQGMSMQELDLSSTSLVRLPSAGLQDIEVLRIENTQTLKTIPSIYNFKNLQKAYLTHSFHCCAFKFPSRHDPRRHAERLKEIEKWQQQCNSNKNRDVDNIVDYDDDDADMNADGAAKAFGESSEVNRAWSWSTKKSAVRSDNAAWQHLPQENPSSNDVASSSNIVDGKQNLLTKANGILYSRLMRSDFPVVDDEIPGETFVWSQPLPEANDMEYIVDDGGFMSDSEIGIFHDPINTESSQLDEYCGNFTFSKHIVDCSPMANDLNPCEDVMGYKWLRISVWIVVALAVIGNVAVLVVLLSIKAESPSVPRFLMCHLAFADLCLGLYLLLIAAIDSHSMGEYFNYAYDWQYGAGCKVAGFLTVFASHLSVFTLTVITIERWLAITHALYLNHRIKLRPASYIMIGGWVYSIIMSSLPLFGISNYSSTSICLPMEDGDLFDTIYLVAIMGLNGVAFFIIAICYGQIYLSLGEETRHAHNTSRGEMSVAKKMALLVFTNFACWAPIAFFGLTALSGYPLINVTKSKILLVFFYPLNSCADPYLYAILTSQYRQDLYSLLAKFGLCQQKAMKYKNSISFPATSNYTCSIQRHASLIPKIPMNSSPPETEIMLKGKEDFV